MTKQRRYFIGNLLCSFLLCFGTYAQAADESRSEVVGKLTAFQKSVGDWRASFQKMAASGKKSAEIVADIGDHPDASAYLADAQRLFMESAQGPQGYQALMFYLTYSDEHQQSTRDKAFNLLIAHHAENPDVLDMFMFYRPQPHTQKAALAAIGWQTPHESVRGKSLFLTGSVINEQVSRPMALAQRKTLVEEGLSVFRQVIDQYPNVASVDMFGREFLLGERAKELSEVLSASLVIEKMADFPVVDLHGNSSALSDYSGKYLLVDFWATWCGPCKKALPGLVEYRESMAGLPFEIISVSVDDEPETVLEYQQDSQPMPWVNWFVGPDHEVLKQLQIQGYPTYFLLDPNGNILSKSHYFDDSDKAYVKQLLANQK